MGGHRPRSGPYAVDSAWSWSVGLASTWIFFWSNVLFCSSGVLYVHLVDHFEVSHGQAFWPFSLANTLYLIMGPVSGYLMVRGNLRYISLLGTTLVSFAAFLCFINFQYSSILMFLPLVGVAQGLFDPVNRVTIHQVFDRQLPHARSLAITAVTASYIVFPPATQALIETYGLRGTFLLLSGFSMHAIAGSLLLRPPAWIRKRLKKFKRLGSRRTRSRSNSRSRAMSQNENCSVDQAVLERRRQKRLAGLGCVSYMSVDSSAAEAIIGNVDSADDEAGDQETLRRTPSNEDIVIFQQCQVNNAVYQPTVLTLPRSTFFEQTRDAGTAWITRLEFLKNPMFYVITATWFAISYAYISFMVTFVDVSISKGISATRSSVLISVLAVGQLLGQLLSEFVSQRGITTRRTLAMVNCCFLGVLLLCLAPACRSYTSLALLGLMVGWFSGSSSVLFAPMLGAVSGLENLSTSLGCATFLVALVTLGRPSLVGYFRDVQGSYEGLYIALGSTFILLFVTYAIGALFKRFSRSR
ncbi:monocarboxylate transporter 13-like [Ornithodoros turicata]|uniref:monocarboxylate transporter 13-like n=1 Tax=Ornithodoros turicata TaxID=34597 RepID=UPI003138A303